MNVRTRIAPSPTGDPHVGTAYMALFNWAFARHHGGEFILRIEDTDAARSSSESEAVIFESLRWLGLEWSEGPDVGGQYGPYRQSERREIYREHINHLLDAGHVFQCFCSKLRLDEVRQAQQKRKETTRYDGFCLNLSVEEVAEKVSAGEPHVIRMKVPSEGRCVFVDELRGEVSIPYEQVDMQVLIKADGMPTYHFAVVVDDHLMKITHILRGEEWINSVPKHKLLFEYFGWPMPKMVHLPLLRNPDQSKLSKRKNPTSITYYRDDGFLPEALLNYLALMGWSMPDEREIFSKDEMAQAFDVSRISVRGPIFDQTKLRWLNGQYIRALSAQDFSQRVVDFVLNQDHLSQLIPLVQPRVERLSELAPLVDYLVGTRKTLTEEDFTHNKLGPEEVVRVLHHVGAALEQHTTWARDDLFVLCQSLAEAMEMKFRDFLFPLFVGIGGRPVTLDLFDSMVFLGSSISRARLREAIEVFSVSGKGRKQLDKSYEALSRNL